MDPYVKFYNENRGRLFNYLMRMTGDYDLARDLMQEGFTRYLEHYRGKPQNTSLLYTIARNALLDHLRKRESQDHTELTEENPDPSRNQEHKTLIKEEYRRVLDAIAQLDGDDREILAFVMNGDLTYKQVSAITGISEANVKVRVHRARVRIRDILGEGVK